MLGTKKRETEQRYTNKIVYAFSSGFKFERSRKKLTEF